jgi:hypothetical protein
VLELQILFALILLFTMQVVAVRVDQMMDHSPVLLVVLVVVDLVVKVDMTQHTPEIPEQLTQAEAEVALVVH